MASNPYESDELLQQYLVFHYASPSEQFPYESGGRDGLEFPVRCVEEGVDIVSLPPEARALDLGCAVGRSSFELARHCSEVIGIDFSKQFIRAAHVLQQVGCIPARRQDEGTAWTELELKVDSAIDRNRVQFETGDAQDLRADLGQFDVVLACNLICRLSEPKRLLSRLPGLVRSGGQLFLTTPFTWMQAHTAPEQWLGSAGQPSFEVLKQELAPNFRLEKQFDLPFLIREHSRKYQYGIALGSYWRRR